MPETRFTRADLMQFPADSEPELPLLAKECCGRDVYPFQQARCQGMQLCHYDCETCGRVWGHYFPLPGLDQTPATGFGRLRRGTRA